MATINAPAKLTQMNAPAEPAQILLTRPSPAYWRVTIDNPPINVMGPEMVKRFQEVISALEADEQVRVVVFDSAVDEYLLYEADTFTLEGHELCIIEQGRTDCPDSTSLHVPSIGLIVAGDVVYNQCRMYVGNTTPESRKNWIVALDRLAALNLAMVVAGHKKPGAPDSPSTIQESKRYLEDFDRLQKTAKSDRELFDQMTELYPHWVANQSWLMFGFPGA